MTENDGYMNDENMWFKRPKINLFLKAAFWNDFEIFSKYHYMTDKIIKSAHCFTIWGSFGFEGIDNDNDNLELVGFISILPHPFGYANRKPKPGPSGYQWREHRTVILPLCQGLGFVSRVFDACAKYLAQHPISFRLQSKTAHP